MSQALASVLVHLRIPWIASARDPHEHHSAVDYILQPSFVLSIILLSFTLVRAACASVLLPAYLILALLRSVLPQVVQHVAQSLSADGRRELMDRGIVSFHARQTQADAQLSGEYVFDRRKALAESSSHPAISVIVQAHWSANREFMEVCGLRICVVHEKPVGIAEKSVVLLHGNPSWSFMYRHVVKYLLQAGLEVYAIDWAGMGGSDKPSKLEEISFELHMQTLLKLFEVYDLHDTHILAHDWGGCVALCSIPHLEKGACTGLMLLNSFFPPSLSDISWNSYCLYLLWLSAQGILAGLVPEEAIIRYMAPSVTAVVVAGYAAPFQSTTAKASVARFARMVPGMPPFVYWLFQRPILRLLEGMCNQDTFSSLHEQTRLRQRGFEVRDYWKSGKASVKVEVVFGKNDTLLGDFFKVLCEGIVTALGLPESHLLSYGGHYAVEEEANTISLLFTRLALESRGSVDVFDKAAS